MLVRDHDEIFFVLDLIVEELGDSIRLSCCLGL